MKWLKKNACIILALCVVFLSVVGCSNKSGITLAQNITLAVNEHKNIEYTLNVSTDTVQWYSSDENVAIVDDGVVYGISEGQTVIYAEVGNEKASCNVTVVKTAFELQESFSFESGYIDSAYVGLSFDLNASLTIGNTVVSDISVMYTSMNTDVIEIVGKTASAKAVGSCSIVAACNYAGKTYNASLDFNVVRDAYSISVTNIEGNDIVVFLNEEKQLTTKLFKNGVEITDSISWSSQNESIVGVENGKVKAKGIGNAKVYAQYGDCKKTINVFVYDKYVVEFLNGSQVLENVKATQTSWGTSVTGQITVEDTEIYGRKPLKEVFLKYTFDEQSSIYSAGITLTQVIDVQWLKELYALGATEIVIPVYSNKTFKACAFDGINARGYAVVPANVWHDFTYNLADFIKWCELNNGDFNASQDMPLFFMELSVNSIELYMDSIYVK